MKSMKLLHENFAKKANQELPGIHRLPICPQTPEVPIIPQNRWELKKDDQGISRLMKSYQFTDKKIRNDFIRDILLYEEEFEHSSSIVVSDTLVTLTVTTKSIGVTEIDKDYARYADEVYKDITFNV